MPELQRYLKVFGILVAVVLFPGQMVIAREPFKQIGSALAGIGPYVDYSAHSEGKLQVILSNKGEIGTLPGANTQVIDPLTGISVRWISMYPANSDICYGPNPVMWLGAIVDRDTLVSTSARSSGGNGGEFWPDYYPFGAIEKQSINATSPLFSPQAHSELDLIATYFDTLTRIDLVGRNHVSLGVKVTQRSMAWSPSNVDDFILVNYDIQNIGSKTLRQFYFGLYCDASAYFIPVETVSSPPMIKLDNLAGFLKNWKSEDTCDFNDTLNLAYGMDNDGNPSNGAFIEASPLAAVGMSILHTPVETHTVNYNWWSYNGILNPYLSEYWDFEPTHEIAGEPYWRGRSGFDIFSTDADKYHLMARREVDYDQLWSGVDMTSEGWQFPSVVSRKIATGGGTYYLLSAGGFDLSPGERTSFTISIVGGDNVHVEPNDFANYWNPDRPWEYYSKLDFTELATNARWAKWVYDNPGVDSDGDGYFGKFRVCDGDTNWYEGDGVPDFRADIPPPSPKLKVIPSLNKLVIRWNGYYSENAIDPFTKQRDFEGYRVYWGLDDRESSFSTLISWDRPNYNRYYLKERPNHTFVWETKDLPFTIDSLRILYGDSFSPLLYTKDNPLHVGDTLYSFTPVDYNLSSFLPDGVHKVYPDAVNPGTDTTLWTEDQLTTEHGSSLPNYYEYEYIIENVLPTVANYISVTAFDFGFAKGNIPAKESSKRENQTIAYAQTSADSVEANDLNVYVYPNPYIWQKDYHSLGYENRDNTQIPARSHRINFGNLPPKCRISVYSLDGDLIRSWDHDYDPNDPQGMHDAWDLITRNTMLAVAGLYYWVVESSDRTQIGKLVIIE